MSTEAATILTTIYQNEKRIKELKESPELKLHIKEFNELLASVRKGYRTLILDFPGFCQDKKDIIGQLWKSCFYKQIEEYRKIIKKCKMQLDMARGNIGLKNHSALLHKEFSAFLGDSLRFFQKFMQELEEKAESLPEQPTGNNNHATTAGMTYDYLNQQVHRSLLFLGDLSRYKELYSESESKDFAESVRYYERAALLMPTSGNAQNQLAMLATYNEAESTALYHYCRSIMTKNPFTGGFENMARLFVLNKGNYEQLAMQAKKPSFDLKSRKPDHTRFKLFLSSFVRLHGILFTWTIRMHRDYLLALSEVENTEHSVESTTLLSHLQDILSNTSTSTTTGLRVSSTMEAEQINVSEIQELIGSILEELDVQLHAAKLSDLHLLRLIAISMFTIHFAEKPQSNSFTEAHLQSLVHSCSHSENSVMETEEDKSPRTTIQSLALIAIFGIVNKISVRYSSAENHEKNKKMYGEKVLPMLSIFSQWLEQHPSYLLTPMDIAGNTSSNPALVTDREDLILPPSVFADELLFTGDSLGAKAPSMFATTEERGSLMATWLRRYCANKDMIRAEARARSSMRTALTLMKDLLEKDMSYMSTASHRGKEEYNKKVCVLLREHAEMRGFLPLGDKFEMSFQSFDPLRKSVTWMSEALSRIERQRILFQFIRDHLVISSPGKDASNVSGRQLFAVETYTDRKRQAKADYNPAPLSQGKQRLTNKEKREMTTSTTKKQSKKKKKKDFKTTDLVPQKEGEDDNDEDDAQEGVEDEDEDDTAMEEFPPLPGSKAPTMHQPEASKPDSEVDTEGYWSYQIESDEQLDLNAFDQLNQSINDVQQDDDQAQPHRQQDDDDEGLDELDDDVVFRPAFTRLPDLTPSPFLSRSSADHLPSLTQDPILARLSSPAMPTSTSNNNLSSDIWASLGLAKSTSDHDLGSLQPLAETRSDATDIWKKFGVTATNQSSLLGGNSILTSDWGEPLSGKLSTPSNVLFQPSWGSNWGVGDSLGASSITSAAPLPPPPGIPAKPVPSGPPPGLISSTGSAKETSDSAKSNPSSNFLSYLNQNPTWKT